MDCVGLNRFAHIYIRTMTSAQKECSMVFETAANAAYTPQYTSSTRKQFYTLWCWFLAILCMSPREL